MPEDRLSEKVEVPTKVTSLSGIRIRDVACGNFQTVCLTERGQVVSWGKDNGKLTCAEPIETGIPYMSALPWKPCYIRMPAVKVAKVHCGFEFSIALVLGIAIPVGCCLCQCSFCDCRQCAELSMGILCQCRLPFPLLFA